MSFRLVRLVPESVRVVLLVIVVAVVMICASTAAAVASYPDVVAQQEFSTNDGGMAVLGDRYALVGTSFDPHNTLYVYDLYRHRVAAAWHLPALRGASAINRAYTMDDLVLSTDQRWLYILNHMRADIVAVDLTGRAAARSIGFANLTPDTLAISPDGRYLYAACTSLLTGRHETDIYDTHTYKVIGRLPASTSIAVRAGGMIYRLLVNAGQARLWEYGTAGQPGRLLLHLYGSALDAGSGGLALSPDGARLYVLWDGLRVLSAATGGILRTLKLPLYPQYTQISLAPDGRQAILWNPDFVQWTDTPTDNPSYILVHYGFIPGALVHVDLSTLRPDLQRFPAFSTLHAVAFTSDSHLVVVDQAQTVTVLGMNAVGRISGRGPVIDLGQFSGGGPNGGAANGATHGGTAGPGCSAYRLTGSWQYTDPRVGGSLTAVLRQNGSILEGTMVDWGGHRWTIHGSVQSRRVELRFVPPGNGYTSLDGIFQGTLSPDGLTITGQAVYAGTPVTNITLTGNACES